MIDNFNIYLITQLKKQPKIGQTPDVVKQTIQSVKDLTDVTTTYLGVMQSQGGQVIEQNVYTTLSTQAQTLVKNLSSLEAMNLKVQSGFNINTKSAAQLGVAIEKVALKQKQNTQLAKQYAGELTNVFVGQTKYLKAGGPLANQVIKQNGLIREQLNVSSEAYENYVRYQASIGGKTDNTTQLATNMELVNDNIANVAASVKGFYDGAATDILNSFSKVSAATTAMYGKNQKGFFLASLQAKALGTDLDETAKRGEGFLNIEESITAELAATIVSGEELTATIRDANGEREVSIAQAMREAVLNKDQAAQLAIEAQLYEKYGEKIKEDIFARKEIAALMNTSEESLVNMVTQYEAMSNINKQIFKTSEADLKVTNAKLETVAALENQQTTAAKAESQTTQQRSKKLGDYSDKVQPTEILEATEKIGALQENTAPLENSNIIKIGVAGKSVIDAGTNIISAGKNLLTPKNDLFIPAGGSETVISGPYGSFSMNPGDDILAMPNIRQATAGGGSDASALIAALQGMSFHVTNVFDGDKIQSNLSIRQGQTLNNINQV